MTKRLKVPALLALFAAACVASQGVYANCQDQGGPYEVRQCANSTWFAAPPAGSGPVSGAWWAIGFGNRDVTGTAAQANPNGDGFSPLIGTNGVPHGVDSGSLPVSGDSTVASLDLVDATTIAGIGAPPGSLCFSSRANWGTPGIDSCIDINRTATGPGGSGSQSDNYVNRYWDAAPTPPGYPETYVYLNHQLDPPMGVLLTEGTGQFFAAAFFATVPKTVPRDADLDPGQYHMGRIVNGDPSTMGANVVPWQPIPSPVHSAVLSDPNDSSSPRNVTMDWSATAPRFIHDNSNRPCLLTDNATPCSSFAGAAGVGVNDQGALIHFETEMVALDLQGNCGTAWTAVPGSRVDWPATTSVANGVPANSCVRLKTSFGVIPTATFISDPVSTTNRDLNRDNSQTGKLGDIGYFVVSPGRKIGGALVSERASLTAVSRERSGLRVKFSTDTELNVTGFDVVGIDGKGNRRVIGTVSCTQCTTGLSASYDTVVEGGKAQGAKKVQIVVQPSGVQSNVLDLK